jgi:hypothetical protein
MVRLIGHRLASHAPNVASRSAADMLLNRASLPAVKKAVTGWSNTQSRAATRRASSGSPEASLRSTAVASPAAESRGTIVRQRAVSDLEAEIGIRDRESVSGTCDRA